MNWFADKQIILVIGEYGISELDIGEYGIGEHGIGEHGIGLHTSTQGRQIQNNPPLSTTPTSEINNDS